MAEASSAVAFQFYVADDGIHYQFSPKVFYIIARMFFKEYAKRFARLSNKIRSGTFPSSLLHLLIIETIFVLYSIYYPGVVWPVDALFHYIDFAYRFLPWYMLHCILLTLHFSSLFSQGTQL